MTAREKYVEQFGSFSSLAEQVHWSTGLSNMFEWLTWSTSEILGVTKTDLCTKAVTWSHEVGNKSLEEKKQIVAQKIKAEMIESERGTPRNPRNLIASPREALRRAKFYSEDFLNKEFDIFWYLASDKYLDEYYGQFAAIVGGGRWYTHGNGGLFRKSTGIREMQIDNLAYNPSEGLLVANELKLGGKKNDDQILKYALMFKRLIDGKFIGGDTRFVLLFIGDTKHDRHWQELIAEEVNFCERSSKSTAREALKVVSIAQGAAYDFTTWRDMIEFNDRYLAELNPATQQVERKLVWGFNETLKTKHFMNSRNAKITG